MQQCAIIITQYKKYYICKFKLLKNDKFCNNPLKPHCSAPCIEPHHQFIPLWGAEGITDATGATCSPHSNLVFPLKYPMGHPQRPILVADKCEHFFLGRFTRFFDGREMKITKNHICVNKMLNILNTMI